MAAGADRLSGLCDDLLVSIISFLPTMEAGRTAVLSRRWRPLWRRTDTLNLDSKSYPIIDPDLSWLWSGTSPVTIKYKLFSTAKHALDARDRRCPITKLSLFVKGPDVGYCEDVMCDTYDLLASLLAIPALRRIEELRVEFEFEDDEEEEDPHDVCHLDPASLPGDTLRVLDLPCCRLKSPPGSAPASCFPRMSVLRLYYCTSSTKHLEDLIRAMPNLTSLHVEGHRFHYLGGGTDTDRLLVHSPSLIALTLVDGLGTRKGIELDTPHLRAFKYNRPLTEFSMKSQGTELAHVDLTLERMYDKHDGQRVGLRSAPFWQFLGNFQHMKTIRLKVQNIECIAAVNHKRSVMLPALERLELDAPCEPACRDNAAMAIASFLKCCPIIHDLRIRVATDAWDYRGRLTNFVLRIRCTRELVPAALLGPDGSAHARWGPWFFTICQPHGFFDWLPGFEWLSVLFDPRAKETNGSIESSKQRRKRKRDY